MCINDAQMRCCTIWQIPEAPTPAHDTPEEDPYLSDPDDELLLLPLLVEPFSESLLSSFSYNETKEIISNELDVYTKGSTS